MKLYDIPAELIALEGELIAASELPPDAPETKEILDALQAKFQAFLTGSQDKIEAGACVVRTLELQAEAAANEAKRLANRAASFDANAERLKALILIAIDAAYGGKVKTPLFTIWGQTSAETTAIDIVPGTDLVTFGSRYPEFVRVKHELDKAALKIALKSTAFKLPEEIVAVRTPGVRYLRIK